MGFVFPFGHPPWPRGYLIAKGPSFPYTRVHQVCAVHVRCRAMRYQLGYGTKIGKVKYTMIVGPSGPLTLPCKTEDHFQFL
jgi:hypothetical protein